MRQQRHGPLPLPRIRATDVLRAAVDAAGEPRWTLAIRIGLGHSQLISELLHRHVPATPANRDKYLRIAAIVNVSPDLAYEPALVREPVNA
jgi:hypothetical protein